MVGFSDAETHRQHYKSDWHRYNLKRKIMELPPVSAEAFNEKVNAAKAEAEAANADTSMFCENCHKRFGNKNAYDNHLSSKKHKEAVLKFPDGQGVKVRAVHSDALIINFRCLRFCDVYVSFIFSVFFYFSSC
jgi:hypothetical protein